MKLKEAFDEWRGKVNGPEHTDVYAYADYSVEKHLVSNQTTVRAYSYSYDKFLAVYHFVGKDWGVSITNNDRPRAEKFKAEQLLKEIDERINSPLVCTIRCDSVVPSAKDKQKKKREFLGWALIEYVRAKDELDYGASYNLYAFSKGSSQPVRVDCNHLTVYKSNSETCDQCAERLIKSIQEGDDMWGWGPGSKDVALAIIETPPGGVVELEARLVGSQAFAGVDRYANRRKDTHKYMVIPGGQRPPQEWIDMLKTHIVSKALTKAA